MSYLSALRKQTGLHRQRNAFMVPMVEHHRVKEPAPIEKRIEIEATKPVMPDQELASTPETNKSFWQESRPGPSHDDTDYLDPFQSRPNDQRRPPMTSDLIEASRPEKNLPSSSNGKIVQPIDEAHQVRNPSSQTSRINQKSSPSHVKQTSTLEAINEIHVQQDSLLSAKEDNQSVWETGKPAINQDKTSDVSNLPSEKKAQWMNIFHQAKQWVNEGDVEVTINTANDQPNHDWLEARSPKENKQPRLELAPSKVSPTGQATADNHQVEEFNLSIGNINIEIEAPATSMDTKSSVQEKPATPKATFLNWQRRYVGF